LPREKKNKKKRVIYWSLSGRLMNKIYSYSYPFLFGEGVMLRRSNISGIHPEILLLPSTARKGRGI